MCESLSEKKTGIMIMVRLVRGKAMMDEFERLVSAERGNKTRLGPTDNEEYDL